MEMCPFPTEIFSISHISSFDIVHMWWTLWIILEGKCECLKFLQFHTLQKWSPHIVTKLVGKISGSHQTSSIKKMLSLIFWILSKLSHSLTKKQQQRFRYVCDFLQLIRSDFPLNSVWNCSLGWNCIWSPVVSIIWILGSWGVHQASKLDNSGSRPAPGFCAPYQPAQQHHIWGFLRK